MILNVNYNHKITESNLFYAIAYLEYNDENPNEEKILAVLQYALELEGREGGCVIRNNQINLILAMKEKYEKIKNWYKEYEYLIEKENGKL